MTATTSLAISSNSHEEAAEAEKAKDSTTTTTEGTAEEENTTSDTNTTNNTTTATIIHATKEFAVGDHVFCWCSYRGLPFAYQQHGIVVEVNTTATSKEENQDNKSGGANIVIMNFDYEESEPDDSSHSETSSVEKSSSWSSLLSAINGANKSSNNDQNSTLASSSDQDQDASGTSHDTTVTGEMEPLECHETTSKELECDEPNTLEPDVHVKDDNNKENETNVAPETFTAHDNHNGISDQQEETKNPKEAKPTAATTDQQSTHQPPPQAQTQTQTQTVPSTSFWKKTSTDLSLQTQRFQKLWNKDTQQPHINDSGDEKSSKEEPVEQPQQLSSQQPLQENQFTKGLVNFFQKGKNNDQAAGQQDSNEGNKVVEVKPEPLNSLSQEKQIAKGIAAFFQRPSTSSNEEGAKQNTKDDDIPETNKGFQRSESSLSSLFASVPERPCTMTRQIISQQEAQEKWEHVQYGQQWHKRLVSRAGTCSPLQPHPLPVVLLRMHFLQTHPDVLSSISYHHQKANGECIACWCKTGQYTSFQGTAKMGKPGLHAATFGMAAEYGAIWGGQIAAAILFPPAIPFLAAYDIYDVYHYGHTFHASHHVTKEWEERTMEWNQAFSKYVQENRDTVEMIQETLLGKSNKNTAKNGVGENSTPPREIAGPPVMESEDQEPLDSVEQVAPVEAT